jgi:hypothetical protein
MLPSTDKWPIFCRYEQKPNFRGAQTGIPAMRIQALDYLAFSVCRRL